MCLCVHGLILTGSPSRPIRPWGPRSPTGPWWETITLHHTMLHIAMSCNRFCHVTLHCVTIVLHCVTLHYVRIVLSYIILCDTLYYIVILQFIVTLHYMVSHHVTLCSFHCVVTVLIKWHHVPLTGSPPRPSSPGWPCGPYTRNPTPHREIVMACTPHYRLHIYSHSH